LGEKTKIKVVYDSCEGYETFRDVTPTNTGKFVESAFPSGPRQYLKGTHQVFLGEQEKHYIDLQMGRMEFPIGGTQLAKKRPFTKATLNYVLEQTE